MRGSPNHRWVWVKMKPGYGLQVLVHVFPFTRVPFWGYPFFDPQPNQAWLVIVWPWVKSQIEPPVNIPIQPLKQVLKSVVNSPTPKWDPIGCDPEPFFLVFDNCSFNCKRFALPASARIILVVGFKVLCLVGFEVLCLLE